VADVIGSIDWLVITLAGSEGTGPIEGLDLDVLRRAFDGKVLGHITTIQAVFAAPGTRRAVITLLGAITARAGMPGTAGIVAINGAVEVLVKPSSRFVPAAQSPGPPPDRSGDSSGVTG